MQLLEEHLCPHMQLQAPASFTQAAQGMQTTRCDAAFVGRQIGGTALRAHNYSESGSESEKPALAPATVSRSTSLVDRYHVSSSTDTWVPCYHVAVDGRPTSPVPEPKPRRNLRSSPRGAPLEGALWCYKRGSGTCTCKHPHSLA